MHYEREMAKFKKKLKKQRLSKSESEQFWREFDAKFPQPSISINPIGSAENVQAILDSFSKVKSLKLTLDMPNNESFELDEEFIKVFEEAVKRTKSASASQNFRNSKEGLDSESVGNLVRASTETGGNCSFKIDGESTTGEIISRTDEHTKIKSTLSFDETPTDVLIGRAAINKLETLVENGDIKLGNIENLEENELLAKQIKRELE